MQKIAFVFPGQGSQKPGMLASLHEVYPEIGQTFDEASDVLSLDLWSIVSGNPEGLLDQTHITQPALLTASVAIWRVWAARGYPTPGILSGHSLGEYSALSCAGVISFADAVRIVHQRGLYMQEAVPSGTGGMAAILGLDDCRIEAICQEVAGSSVVAPANYNSIGQTVIAGERVAVERAMQACKDAGAKRVVPLNVSVPSHCALMRDAAEKLAADLGNVQLSPARIPVVQNVDGRIALTTHAIRENLLQQLYLPVQWVSCVRTLCEQGYRILVECGPGKVLGGLSKRIDPQIQTFATEDAASLAEAAKTTA
jgi:[acyl-carrier-protein] S-malonyltransferase